MEVTIVEDTKNKLHFEIEGEGHSMANALRVALWDDEHVKAASYAIEHPLIEKPRFVLETDGADPRKTIKAAIKRLQKQVESVKDGAKTLK